MPEPPAAPHPLVRRRRGDRRLYSPPIRYHDVDDVEGLARRVLFERLREWRATLPVDLGEEAVSYLVETAWRLSLDHDPAVQAFSTRCYRTLRLRLVDWYRGEFGDSRRPRPEALSLDQAPDGDSEATWHDAFPDEHENVEEAAATGVGLGVPWAELSEDALETVREIAIPLSQHRPLDRIAADLGQSRRHVARRLDELRGELLAKRPDLPDWLAA